MVHTADFRECNHTTVSRTLHPSRCGRVFRQGRSRSGRRRNLLPRSDRCDSVGRCATSVMEAGAGEHYVSRRSLDTRRSRVSAVRRECAAHPSGGLPCASQARCARAQEEREQHGDHRREASPSSAVTSTAATRTDFPVGTAGSTASTAASTARKKASRRSCGANAGTLRVGNARLKLRAWSAVGSTTCRSTLRHAPHSKSLGRNTAAKRLAHSPRQW